MKNVLLLGVLVFSFGFSSAQNNTNISKEVASLLEKKRAYNRSTGFGYTIQVFNGNETAAKTKQAKFKILYPRVETKLIYNAPEWKVQVGNYKTKLEADREMLIFKKEFSGIIAIPIGK